MLNRRDYDYYGLCPTQRHVHEVQGSVDLAPEANPHSHRFATVSGQAKCFGCHDHYHDIFFRTDFVNEHFHEFCGRTGGAIRVGDRHVHFVESCTTMDREHRHKFRLSTLMEDLT
jgi:hypothetical protein